MTIEARSRILGIPVLTRELSYVEGEMFLRRDKFIDFRLDTRNVASTFRILSDDEIAVFNYFQESTGSHRFVKGKPQILEKDEINKANLHSSGILYRVDLRWKPTK